MQTKAPQLLMASLQVLEFFCNFLILMRKRRTKFNFLKLAIFPAGKSSSASPMGMGGIAAAAAAKKFTVLAQHLCFFRI